MANAAQPTPGPEDQGLPKSQSAEETARTHARAEESARTHARAEESVRPWARPDAANAAAGPAGDAGRAGATTAAPESMLQTLKSIAHELPALISDRVDLLSLELQRAGRALAQIVALIVAGAILGITAWLVLWAAIVAGLVALGMPMAAALFLVVVLNLGTAAWALMRVRKLVPSLGLPATRRHLMVSPSTKPAAGAPDPAAP